MDALIPNDRACETKAALARIKDGQSAVHLETSRIRKDVTAITVSASLSPIRDVEGAIVGASTITHEVTTKMEALEPLGR